MTYNFDLARWYDNERSAIEATRKMENWSDEEYEMALENLEERYEGMIRRLDRTYQLPK
jgi:hypothetical protein